MCLFVCLFVEKWVMIGLCLRWQLEVFYINSGLEIVVAVIELSLAVSYETLLSLDNLFPFLCQFDSFLFLLAKRLFDWSSPTRMVI